MIARACTILMMIALSLPRVGWAQDAEPAAAAPAEASSAVETGGGPRKQLATIVFTGLGGAILGLSTLSFYGRPQDKLANIAIGFALGVIVGTSMVTYRAATNPDQFYNGSLDGDRELREPMDSATVAKVNWSWNF